MTKTTVDHIVINISDENISKEFYSKILGFLGFKIVKESKITESGRSFIGYGKDGVGVWLRKSVDVSKQQTYAGYNHIAFAAESRKQIIELQNMLQKNNYKILYRAGAHPEFAPTYYSISFFDPDGTVIELVHR